MKWLVTLFGILVITNLVFSKPAPESSKDDDDDDFQNDDYDENDYEEGEDILPEDNGPEPEIKTRPLTLRGKPGGSVELPCEIINGENSVTLWKKNGQLIFQDTISTGAQISRYQIFKNKTIQIQNMNSEDSATYTCEVAGSNAQVSHTLEVDTPPKITKIHPSDKLEVLSGETVELNCEASGVPKPKIKWAKSGTRISSSTGYEGPKVTFENIQKDNAGIYQCMADNEVNPPATASVEIIVKYAPTIKIEKLTVNSAEGYESVLTCIVHGYPKPVVQWKRNNEILKSDNNLNIINEGNHHILKILHTKKSDFGNYTCMAENAVGDENKHVLLSGKPTPAEFVSAAPSPAGGEVHLQYRIESNSPIVEYQVQYRIKGESEWKSESPKVTNAEGNVYTMLHTLSNLEHTIYEVKVRSKNTYGWSHYSQHKNFDAKPHLKDDQPPLVSENIQDPQRVGSSAVRLSPVFTILVLSVFYCKFV